MSWSTGPKMGIWKKWSMTQRLCRPACSASVAIRPSVGPIRSGPPGQVKLDTDSPIRMRAPLVSRLICRLSIAGLVQVGRDPGQQGDQALPVLVRQSGQQAALDLAAQVPHRPLEPAAALGQVDAPQAVVVRVPLPAQQPSALQA